MNNEAQSTADTTYGPAQCTVSADGLLFLTWPDGISLNRVCYTSASTYQTRSTHSGRVTTQVYLSRDDWGKPISDAARSALEREAERLASLLITPEAVARARVQEAKQLTQRTQRQLADAQNADARARAEYQAARDDLARLEAGQGAA